MEVPVFRYFATGPPYFDLVRELYLLDFTVEGFLVADRGPKLIIYTIVGAMIVLVVRVQEHLPDLELVNASRAHSGVI